MVHHLQQHVVDVRMRLLDLVEQQHAVRLLGDSLGQQTALVETDIARRRTDQARHSVALHVLGHVETDQFDAQDVGQLLGHFGLAHAGGAAEQEAADRLVGLAQARAGHLDGSGQGVDGRLLAEHHALQVAVQGLELAAVVVADRGRWDARDLCDDLFDLIAGDGLLLLALGQDALRGTGLVDHVDGLVGQVAVVDELGRQLGRGLQRTQRVLHVVVVLEAALEALQDLDRLLDRRLDHVDLLEAPRQRRILLEDATVLGEGGRADALHRAVAQGRLEQVGRIQRAARRRTGTDQGVDLVDEQHRAGLVLQLLEHTLETLLEVTAVLGARQQRTHVQRIDGGGRQHFGHVALGDAPGQAFGDRRLAHAGFAHQQRVVLAAAAQDLDHAFHFMVAADQRVDLAVLGLLVQVLGELVQWRALAAVAGFFLLAALAVAGLSAALGGFGRLALLDAVGDEVHHVQPCDTLLVQVVHRVGILLAEDGHQHIGAGDFLLAAAGALHMHDGALDHPLETKCGLGVHLLGAADGGRVFLDEGGEALAQVVDVGGAGLQHFGRGRVVQQREQQVLDGDELMALLARLDERHVQADFQFLRNHAASIMHCSGCPARRAAASTSSTLVAATSLV